MKTQMKLLLCFFFLTIATACSSAQKSESTPAVEGKTPVVTREYEKLIEKFSSGDTEYSGFYNNFEYRATLLNSTVRDTVLQKQSEQYQWDHEKLMAEKEKAGQEMGAQTDVFLSFFTPDHQNDNLTDAKSIWRIYLEVGGHRYQGKPARLRSLLAELQALYPYHTRWNTAYQITFPVPTNAIETQNAIMTITGPLGTRAITFNSVQ